MAERKPQARPNRSATGGPRSKRPTQPPPRKKSGKSIVNQKQTPWGLIAAIAGVVVFAVVIVVVVVLTRHTSSSPSGQIIPSTPTGSVTAQQQPTRVANTSGIRGVLAWDTQGWPGNGQSHPGAVQHNHVTGPVTYSVVPPVGGPHNATWMNAGVYTEPVPSERAVHNLEHGAVWITYDPKLSKQEVAALTAFVGKQSLIAESQQATGVAGQANRYMDLSPWPTNTLPAPIVLSSWGHQLRVTSPHRPAHAAVRRYFPQQRDLHPRTRLRGRRDSCADRRTSRAGRQREAQPLGNGAIEGPGSNHASARWLGQPRRTGRFGGRTSRT